MLLAAACRAGHPGPPRLRRRPEPLLEHPPARQLGTDLFVFHGYAELLIAGRWLKATPAFNRELCGRFGVAPLTFDGTTDALFQPFDDTGRRHMEYVRERGTAADLPLAEILRVFRETYPNLSLEAWRRSGSDPAFET